MTSRSRVRARKIEASARVGRRRRRGPVVAIAAAAVVATVAVSILVLGGGTSSPTSASAPRGIQATGVVRAGGVEVTGAKIALGQVPLNTTVTPTWRLLNTGSSTVQLGDPHIQVVEGCCPGPATFGRTSLAPGEETTLTFPLTMHPGMDGPHDFMLHVPVGAETMELEVTGLFQ